MSHLTSSVRLLKKKRKAGNVDSGVGGARSRARGGSGTFYEPVATYHASDSDLDFEEELEAFQGSSASCVADEELNAEDFFFRVRENDDDDEDDEEDFDLFASSGDRRLFPAATSRTPHFSNRSSGYTDHSAFERGELLPPPPRRQAAASSSSPSSFSSRRTKRRDFFMFSPDHQRMRKRGSPTAASGGADFLSGAPTAEDLGKSTTKQNLERRR